jgi:hypothetical protein
MGKPIRSPEGMKRFRERRAKIYAADNYGVGIGNHGNHRRTWTQKEDKRVLAHEVPDRELAKEIDRTVNAIWARRRKLRARDAHLENI